MILENNLNKINFVKLPLEKVNKEVNNLEKKYGKNFNVSIDDIKKDPDLTNSKKELDESVIAFDNKSSELDTAQKDFWKAKFEQAWLISSKDQQIQANNERKNQNTSWSNNAKKNVDKKVSEASTNIWIAESKIADNEKIIKEKKHEYLENNEINWLNQLWKTVLEKLGAYKTKLLEKYNAKIKWLSDSYQKLYETQFKVKIDALQWDYKSKLREWSKIQDEINLIKNNKKIDNNKNKKIDELNKNLDKIQEEQLDIYSDIVPYILYKYKVNQKAVKLEEDLYKDLSKTFGEIDDKIKSQEKYFDYQISKYSEYFKISSNSEDIEETINKKREYEVKLDNLHKNDTYKNTKTVISELTKITNYIKKANDYSSFVLEYEATKSIYGYRNDIKENLNQEWTRLNLATTKLDETNRWNQADLNVATTQKIKIETEFKKIVLIPENNRNAEQKTKYLQLKKQNDELNKKINEYTNQSQANSKLSEDYIETSTLLVNQSANIYNKNIKWDLEADNTNKNQKNITNYEALQSLKLDWITQFNIKKPEDFKEEFQINLENEVKKERPQNKVNQLEPKK